MNELILIEYGEYPPEQVPDDVRRAAGSARFHVNGELSRAPVVYRSEFREHLPGQPISGYILRQNSRFIGLR